VVRAFPRAESWLFLPLQHSKNTSTTFLQLQQVRQIFWELLPRRPKPIGPSRDLCLCGDDRYNKDRQIGKLANYTQQLSDSRGLILIDEGILPKPKTGVYDLSQNGIVTLIIWIMMLRYTNPSEGALKIHHHSHYRTC
jgi:hypothetical protein